MTGPNLPDLPKDGSVTGHADSAGRPADPPQPGGSPPQPEEDPPQPGENPLALSASAPRPVTPSPSVPRLPPVPSGDVPKRGRKAHRFVPPRFAPHHSVAARLLLLLPVLLGILLVEGLFAARGQPGDPISMPAAGLALVLAWLGTAWALRSWVMLLVTFVPAVMLALGAAMVVSNAPGAGVALVLVGGALLGAVISFRLSAPAPRWNPGWSASWPSGGSSGAGTRPWPASGGTPARGSVGGSVGAGSGSAQSGDHSVQPGPPMHQPRPLDPFGAHFLAHPSDIPLAAGADGQEPGGPPDRTPPDWDTSRTDIAARDRLVAKLCGRGGTAGPTLATVEEFFTGNGDPHSIAPGLRGAVPLATFVAVLRTLRAHRRVAEVLVQVDPLLPGRYPAGEWPAAGSIHVVATLDADELDALVADLRPEPALGPLPADELASGAPAPEGSAEFSLWWE